jgi:hypothetical protein
VDRPSDLSQRVNKVCAIDRSLRCFPKPESTVQHHRTSRGTTVSFMLQHPQSLRPFVSNTSNKYIPLLVTQTLESYCLSYYHDCFYPQVNKASLTVWLRRLVLYTPHTYTTTTYISYIQRIMMLFVSHTLLLVCFPTIITGCRSSGYDEEGRWKGRRLC